MRVCTPALPCCSSVPSCLCGFAFGYSHGPIFDRPTCAFRPRRPCWHSCVLHQVRLAGIVQQGAAADIACELGADVSIGARVMQVAVRWACSVRQCVQLFNAGREQRPCHYRSSIHSITRIASISLTRIAPIS